MVPELVRVAGLALEPVRVGAAVLGQAGAALVAQESPEVQNRVARDTVLAAARAAEQVRDFMQAADQGACPETPGHLPVPAAVRAVVLATAPIADRQWKVRWQPSMAEEDRVVAVAPARGRGILSVGPAAERRSIRTPEASG